MIGLAFLFDHAQRPVVRRMLFPQMPPESHIQGDGHAHNDQCANAQDQKPPDHPHDVLGYQTFCDAGLFAGLKALDLVCRLRQGFS